MAIVLNDVASPNNTSVMNSNFQKIEDAINDDVLRREIDAGDANEMRTHLDMNSNKITNVTDGTNDQDAATYGQLTDVEDSAQASADAAAASATASAASASSSAGSAAAAANSVTQVSAILAADPENLIAIARSLNVADTAVLDSTDTTTLLDNVSYIYDATAQTTWGVPSLDSTGKTIVSVVGSALTTTGGTGGNSYTLTTINKSGIEFETITDIDNGDSIGGKVSLLIGDSVVALDYAVGNNSGALFFKVIAAGTGTDDGGKYIDLPIHGLQLEQNLKTPYDVKAWGAVGDGVSDDEPPISNAIAFALPDRDARAVVLFPTGTYLCNDDISLTDRRYFTLLCDGLQNARLEFQNAKGVKILGCRDWEIRGIDIDTDLASGECITVESNLGAGYWNVTRFFITDVSTRGYRGCRMGVQGGTINEQISETVFRNFKANTRESGIEFWGGNSQNLRIIGGDLNPNSTDVADENNVGLRFGNGAGTISLANRVSFAQNDIDILCTDSGASLSVDGSYSEASKNFMQFQDSADASTGETNVSIVNCDVTLTEQTGTILFWRGVGTINVSDNLLRKGTVDLSTTAASASGLTKRVKYLGNIAKSSVTETLFNAFNIVLDLPGEGNGISARAVNAKQKIIFGDAMINTTAGTGALRRLHLFNESGQEYTIDVTEV